MGRERERGAFPNDVITGPGILPRSESYILQLLKQAVLRGPHFPGCIMEQKECRCGKLLIDPLQSPVFGQTTDVLFKVLKDLLSLWTFFTSATVHASV